MKLHPFFSYLLLPLMFIAGCTQDVLFEDTSNIAIEFRKVTPLSESESLTLMTSVEARELFSLRLDFLDTLNLAINGGEHIDTIRNLCLDAVTDTAKYNQLLSVLFSSTSTGEAFFSSIEDARDDLFSEYPTLDTLADSHCIALDSNINALFDDFSSIRSSLTNNSGSTYGPGGFPEGGSGPVCGSYWQQVKLLACAAACSTLTGGVGVALCGWACWCTLCTENSEVYNLLC